LSVLVVLRAACAVELALAEVCATLGLWADDTRAPASPRVMPGVLVSLLLRHGYRIYAMTRAISRDSDGSASGLIGAVLDKIHAGEWSRS
jgi:hypothetical protein